MSFDPRIPMGLMFTITGMILSAFGLATRNDAALYVKCLGVDVNLWWGLVLFALGLTMYILGVRRQRPVENEPPAPAKRRRLGRRH